MAGNALGRRILITCVMTSGTILNVVTLGQGERLGVGELCASPAGRFQRMADLAVAGKISLNMIGIMGSLKCGGVASDAFCGCADIFTLSVTALAVNASMDAA